jgi:hypothetical protein
MPPWVTTNIVACVAKRLQEFEEYLELKKKEYG